MTTAGRTQAYSAGNKTYGFGRSNPTSGPVDPLGYRERDMAQNTFGNAVARRVGSPKPAAPIASNYNNLMSSLNAQLPKAAATPTGTIGTNIAPMAQPQTTTDHNDAGNLISGPPMGVQPVANPQTDLQQGNYQGFVDHANAQLPAAPSGYVDPAGPTGMNVGGIPGGNPGVHQMPGDGSQPFATMPGNGSSPQFQQMQAPQDLGPDVQYQNELSGLERAKTDAYQKYLDGTNKVNTDIYGQERDINQAAPSSYEHLLEQFASHGMAHSGRYAQDFGNAQNDTARQVTDLENNKVGQLQSLLAMLTGANSTFENSKAAAAQSLAQRLAARQPVVGQ